MCPQEFQSFWEMSRNKDWIINLFISILSYKALPLEASKKESQGILCLYTYNSILNVFICISCLSCLS